MSGVDVEKPMYCTLRLRQRPILPDGCADLWGSFNLDTYPAHCRASMDYMPPLIRHEFAALMALDDECALSLRQLARFDALLLEYHRAVTPEKFAQHIRELEAPTPERPESIPFNG